MKLTIKLLKEMIRKELKEAGDPFGKKGGYMGRGIGAQSEVPDVEAWKAEDRQKDIQSIASLMSKFNDNYEDDRFSNFDDFLEIMQEELPKYQSDEELLEIYNSAKEYALGRGWLEEYDFDDDEEYED